MSYRIKRFDPFWFRHPAVGGAAVLFSAVAVIGVSAGSAPAFIGGAILGGGAVLLATKPALSAVFFSFGLLGGVLAFLTGSNPGMSPFLRLAATGLFGVFYAALMDAGVLALSAVYNRWTGFGFKGLSLDLEG